MLEPLELLKEELESIESRFVRKFVEHILTKVPDYFYHIPASSTGKYHPKYALGEGGLLRHTKAAVKIANSIFEATAVWNFDSETKDVIRAALILHDTCKNGFKGSKYTEFNHPMLVEKLIDISELQNIGIVKSTHEVELIHAIIGCIRAHMGCWNIDRYGTKVMPLPVTDEQKFCHLCDYLASRKFLEVEF